MAGKSFVLGYFRKILFSVSPKKDVAFLQNPFVLISNQSTPFGHHSCILPRIYEQAQSNKQSEFWEVAKIRKQVCVQNTGHAIIPNAEQCPHCQATARLIHKLSSCLFSLLDACGLGVGSQSVPFDRPPNLLWLGVAETLNIGIKAAWPWDTDVCFSDTFPSFWKLLRVLCNLCVFTCICACMRASHVIVYAWCATACAVDALPVNTASYYWIERMSQCV